MDQLGNLTFIPTCGEYPETLKFDQEEKTKVPVRGPKTELCVKLNGYVKCVGKHKWMASYVFRRKYFARSVKSVLTVWKD